MSVEVMAYARCRLGYCSVFFLIVWGLGSFAAPARAIDCSKAVTNVDKAICSNDALLAADRSMAGAYTALLSGLNETDRPALKRSQLEWLKRRGWCDNSDKPISECVLRETIDRMRILRGEPLSGPGTSRKIVPMFISQLGGEAQYDLDVIVLRFAEAESVGARAYNAQVDKLLDMVPTGQIEDGVQTTAPYSYSMAMSVQFASPRFISAKTVIYDYSGGAHGNSSTQNINLDLRSGELTTLEHLFKPSANSILVQGCFAQIQAAKKNRFGDSGDGLFKPQEQRQIVSATLGEMVNWSFTQSAGSVVFDPYVIGAYAEGRYECSFEMDILQALMKSGSPLSQQPVN